MMYPRLQLLRQFLQDDGAIFISIDDNEVAYMRLILDEIFGARNFIACVTWQKKYALSNDDLGIPAMHDYIIVYQRSDKFARNLLPRSEKQNKLYKNPDNDPRGLWASDNYLCNKSADQRPNLYYPIIHPVTSKEIWPSRTAVWRYEKVTHEQHIQTNRVWWGLNRENEVPRFKRFLHEVGGVTPGTWWPHEEAGHNDEAKKQIKEILKDAAQDFDTPKPIRLIKRILQLATDKDALVLDAFAGSGTTGHAVMQLNAEDGGNRRFVLVEMEPHIARNITAERLRRVIGGYGDKPGLGGTFAYATLGDALIDADGQLGAGVTYADLARYIFHKETGETLADMPEGSGDGFLGEWNGISVFLLWGKGAERVLDTDVLRRLAARPGLKTVYADACPVAADRLARANVRFLQTRYVLAAS